MRSADVEPSRPPSLSLAPSDMAHGAEQPEDADPEAEAAGEREEADLEGIRGMCALDGLLAERISQEQELGDTQDCSRKVDHARRLPAPRPVKPFQRWIRTLHRRAIRRQDIPGYDGSLPPWPCEKTEHGDSRARGSSHHRQSSSDSSIAFVTRVKSATVSVAGASLLSRSRKTTIRSFRDPRTERSRRASISGPRVSEDSCCPEIQLPLDPAVSERALQRRRILEELISTEESYIGDVRFLMNVYVTILASLPTSPAGLRSSVNRNLTDIVELHEEILGELHQAVPDSEYTQVDLPVPQCQSNASTRGHFRWRSLDAVPEGKDDISWLRDAPGMTAEPSTAAEVAKIFSKRVNRFFIYEEYGAKYELMIRDVAAAHRTMPSWLSYQKGLEVLASSLGSADNRGSQSRKALTTGDLLVKPIQRVLKYPLLFAELLRCTPVIDCPFSHMEIENALIRLREANAEINRATNDSRTKSVLEKTWILQDRLVFPDNQLDAASKSRIRSFGHVRLCGALHVCWQTKEGVSGQYMVALLYREWLCLATAAKIDQVYTIQACIALANIRVEEVDNGRGLQCHTARYSWKIVFLSDNQLYELILTACSPKEELEWCARLKNNQTAVTPDGQDQIQSDVFSFLSLNIKSLGTVFRKPGTMARKISIHRATTIGPKSPLYQVILKNTSAAKEGPSFSSSSSSSHHPSSTSINRSQSLLTTNSRIPVLAPARAERARLEALLADVWTRDVLPFPGIVTRSRSEQLASSMMRKLSAVGMAAGSGFGMGRRSASAVCLPPHYQQYQHQREREKGGGGDTVGSWGGDGERQRRGSEGGYGIARATDAVSQLEDLYAPPLVSAGDDLAVADRDCGADGSDVACPVTPRRASAPELEKAPEPGLFPEGTAETSDSRESSSSPGTAISRSRSKSTGEGEPSGSPRESSRLSNTSISDKEDLGKRVESRRAGERRSASWGLGLGEGQRLSKEPTRMRTRTRSQGLEGKMGKRGLKRRGVVVEGIRSWFR